MSLRHFIGTVSSVVLFAGFLTLFWTINAGEDEISDRKIMCGHAIGFDLDTAEQADNLIAIRNTMTSYDSDEHFVADCESTRAFRQALGWPLAAVGLVGLLGSILVRQPKNNEQLSDPTFMQGTPSPGEPPNPTVEPIEK
ncbi:hypothetical protein [Rhodococcus sp. NCIMB 12038]|uniref:hypothetical protein n=1 Tax=Rhodococcus sp. NCIMB 12038 TaxID=933800 RepID=UPI000B3C3871|nr:hypothetical protein [Rhodococcus sp. NCIMB 12038]OUS97296.1 hypothetical protein CA951_02820 [Rhodococcus sp. NCIMB 12038]